jgi:succinyl-CoA synthetase beta subunit
MPFPNRGASAGRPSWGARILAAASVAVDPRFLGDVADRPADGVGCRPHLVPGNGRPPAVRVGERGEDADGRRLAGAGWAEQREDLLLRDRERDAVERDDGPLGLLEPLELDRVHRPGVPVLEPLESAAVDLLEYQGKELFRRYGIPVPEGRLVTSAEEAGRAAEDLGGSVVVKAQVLSGGRGKAGGVKQAAGPGEAAECAAAILGLDIHGHVVSRLLVERASEIASEYYLSVAFDRGARAPLLMLTVQGGVEIEELAAREAAAIARLHVDPLVGYRPFEGRRLVHEAGIGAAAVGAQVLDIVAKLYRCFSSEEAMLCEINPLIVTPAGEVRALDAKVTVDDSALFRHPDLAAMRDTGGADPLEAMARERGVTYVKLDGSVGILANGAGLAMAAVDVVVVAGGTPANFCDLGGGGQAAGVVAALEVIASDPQLRSIFFNVFGGMTRCDEVARGILAALEQIEITVPIVVRLDGTNADEGRRLLAGASLPSLHVEPTMLAAARRAVELAA